MRACLWASVPVHVFLQWYMCTDLPEFSGIFSFVDELEAFVCYSIINLAHNFRVYLEQTGLTVSMPSVNLFYHLGLY